MSFFSIIIPLYNKEKYVESALQSILNQNFTDYEVLIINDCSTDRSVEEIKPYLSDKIKLIHHSENKGLSEARNTGIENATTNYITFLDADDLWKPTFLETIYHLIINFPEARIFGTNYEEIYKTKTYNPFNGSETLPTDFNGYLNFFKINIKQGIYNHGSVCFHKEVYEKVGKYDIQIKFSNDIDFNIRANYHFKLAYSNTIQMSYFMEVENQITRNSVLHKLIPDYDKYESWTSNNSDLKKHLDFFRYVLAKKLKRDGDSKDWKEIIKSIDFSNLNWKQRLLLKCPRTALLFVEKTKAFLLKFGLKTSTYSN
ncbi:MAG: glycosyltransferase family 2 protein [Bacteroidota bacterium]